VAEALRAGARAMASAILSEPIDLLEAILELRELVNGIGR
jgi:hypothetical protein